MSANYSALWLRVIPAVALILLIGSVFSPCLAFEFAGEVELSMGSAFDRGEQDSSKVFEAAYISQGRLPTELAFGHINGSDFSKDNLDKSVNYFALGKRLRYGWFFVGLGFVVTDQTSSRLSTNFNFKSLGGVQLGPLVGKVEHLSNAGIAGENDGDTFFSLGFRFALP